MTATKAACTTVDPQFVVVMDDDAKIRAFVETTLTPLGMRVESFPAAKEAFVSIDGCHPAIIFLDVALLRSDAIDVLRSLGERHYGGFVQLISGGRPSLLEAIQRIGVRQGISVTTPLHKPLTREAIVRALDCLRSPDALAAADREAAPQLPSASGR
jgi:DNA-binding NtrC family response regulator